MMSCPCRRTVLTKVTIPAWLSYTGKERIDEKPLDYCIAPLVNSLNMSGIATCGSCCGHGKNGEIFLCDGTIISIQVNTEVL